MNRLRLGLLALSLCSLGADWPGFRGSNNSGTSTEKNLPTSFSESSGLRWKATMPGRGVSGVVTVGDNVYVTCSHGNRDDQLHVLCLDAKTGEQLWHREFLATGNTTAHPDTCMAAPTPVADANGVYALFASGDLAAFTPKGKLLWYRSLVDDYPTISNQVGMASSPLLVDGKLIVPMDNAGDSFIAAIDVKTGQNLWKTSRPKEVNWVTPIARKLPTGTEILFPGRDLSAYDLETGKKTWNAKLPGGSIPSPTLIGDLLIAPGSGVVATKLTGNETKELWKSARLQTGMTSPLFYEGKVYGISSAGVLVCVDAKNGQQVWDMRVKGKFSASPIAADGKLFLFSEEGKLYTIKLGEEPEIIGESETKERGQATPAISGGAIYLRGTKTLFCVGSK
ncbi:MAG: PQQ-binding-like beta-propeller repeat protein [Fimbriiglobus sp.]